MKKVKQSRKNNANYNISFIILNVVFFFIFIATCILSVLDLIVWHIDWGKHYAIDVLCNVIASATFFVGSIIGIAIPLQKEKLYGITIQEFNKLRGSCRYSVICIIIISISLAVFNALFLTFKMILACFGVSLISVAFCIWVSYAEIPLMMGQEKRLNKILKKYVTLQITNVKSISDIEKIVLQYLVCYKKTFIETYNLLKQNDTAFNKKLILRLLEVQELQAKDLCNIDDKNRQRNIASALISNIKDILNFSIDLTSIFGSDATIHINRVIKVLFCLDELPEFSKTAIELVVEKIHSYDYLNDKNKENFIMSVVLIMISDSITSGNFRFAKAMRKLLSAHEILLDDNNVLSLIMSLMSLHFYYLCNDAYNVTVDLKYKIHEFINFAGIEDNTKIIPWKQLFLKHIENYNLKFENLLDCYNFVNQYWDIILTNIEARFVILTKEYVLQWYLTCLFHSFSIWDFDFNSLLISDEIKNILKTIGDNMFFAGYDEPKLTEQMENFAKFYGLSEHMLESFVVNERRNHRFFHVINSLHIEDLKSDQKKAKNVDLDTLIDIYKTGIEEGLSLEWGFDSNLKVNSESKYLHLILEKTSDAINYKEVLIKYILNLIYKELSKKINKNIIITDENFDSNISQLAKRHIKAVTRHTQFLITDYITSEEVLNSFNDAVKYVNRITSKIFIGDYIFIDDSFSFNCKLTKISWRELSAEEVSRQADGYKRADGQYIFKGARIARELVEQYIKDQYYVLDLEMQFAINEPANSIYEIQLSM